MNSGVTFQYFTYFLNILEQGRLFDDKRDKNDIFRDLLKTKKIEYENRGVKLAFVFVEERNGYFICKLGKRASIKRHLPPDQNFEETLEESWPYCTVVINTNSNAGAGQKIAFELRSQVFASPDEQLKHFADEVNTTLATFGYVLSINPVTEEREFWKVVEANEGKIERLTLSFNAPNLFGLDNSLNEDLKELEKQYGSTKVSINLENPVGKIKVPKTPLTKQGVEYITKGGGEYEIKLKGRARKVIKSKSKTVTKTFENLDITIKGKGQHSLFDVLGKIFE